MRALSTAYSYYTVSNCPNVHLAILISYKQLLYMPVLGDRVPAMSSCQSGASPYTKLSVWIQLTSTTDSSCPSWIPIRSSEGSSSISIGPSSDSSSSAGPSKISLSQAVQSNPDGWSSRFCNQ